MFYLVRHGETDYSERGTRIYQGFGENFACLTQRGRQQIAQTARDERLQGADLILSSPYTRAVQTAAILSKELRADLLIETLLHEWVADKGYSYLPPTLAEKAVREFTLFSGDYPDGEIRQWEDNAALHKRLFEVLKQYRSYKKVIVVCHGMLIYSVCKRWLEKGEIAELKLEELL